MKGGFAGLALQHESYATYAELDALTRQLMAQGKSDPANSARRAFFVKREPPSKLERNRRRRGKR